MFFGKREIAEIIKYFKKLYEGKIQGNLVVNPFNPDNLIYAESRKEKNPVNLIKEKINGIIKGIT